jgi:hypothetical protein
MGFPSQAKSKKEVITVKHESPNRKGGDAHISPEKDIRKYPRCTVNGSLFERSQREGRVQ